MPCPNTHVASVGRALWVLVGWFAGVVFLAPAFAAPTFLTHFWQVEDGLPENGVNAIVQTHDGYIWVATSGGLARFDGVKFKNFDESNTPELKTSQIISLFEDAAGNLWIGHQNGNLTRYKEGRFEAVAIRPGWNKPRIWRLGSDQADDLWLVSEEGLFFRVKDGQKLSPPAGKVAGFYSFERSVDGRIWIGRNGVLSVLENGRFTPLPFDQVTLTNSYVQGICPSSDGGLWVLSDARLRKWKRNQWVEDLGVCPWQYAAVTRIIEMHNGWLAVGTSDLGLYLIKPHGETVCLNHETGLQSDWVRSLFEDREGNLWVGTGAAGLVMLRPSNFLTLDPPDHCQGRAVLSVAAGSNGDLWMGSDGAGLYRYRDKQWTNWAFKAGVVSPYVWSVSPDAQGRVWLGTWGNGLLVKRGDDFSAAPGWQDVQTSVTALLRRADDDYWVGAGLGLLRYQNGKVTSPFERGQVPFSDVRAIAEETNGTVWAGMNGYGLGCLQNGHVRRYSKSHGLASDFVSCLHLDDEGGLWIGTFGGLNRFKNGRWATIKTEQGLPNNVICDIEDDGRGCFWISTHGGIARVQKEKLNRWADGQIEPVHFQCYDMSDGLPTEECSGGFQPAGCAATNGWLYFPTSKGLVTVNPDEITINPHVPPVILEDVLVDDRRWPGLTNGAALLKIPPGRHRFEFCYTALSFVVPEKVRFKYRLNGIDSDWISAGTQRTANYSYIPPGNYTFRVIACNNDDVWNQRGADIAFAVLPFFWQTLWFQLLALALTIAASGGWSGSSSAAGCGANWNTSSGSEPSSMNGHGLPMTFTTILASN